MFFKVRSEGQDTWLIFRDGAREMVQWVEVTATKPDNLSWIPQDRRDSTGERTKLCKLFSDLYLYMCVHTYTHTKIMKCN